MVRSGRWICYNWLMTIVSITWFIINSGWSPSSIDKRFLRIATWLWTTRINHSYHPTTESIISTGCDCDSRLGLHPYGHQPLLPINSIIIMNQSTHHIPLPIIIILSSHIIDPYSSAIIQRHEHHHTASHESRHFSHGQLHITLWLTHVVKRASQRKGGATRRWLVKCWALMLGSADDSVRRLSIMLNYDEWSVHDGLGQWWVMG